MRSEPPPRVLTVRGAAALGISTGRVHTELRRGRWRRLGPGVVLTRPDEATRDDRINAAAAILGADAALSGWDAVRLRRLGGDHPPGPPLLIVRRGRNRVVAGVHIRPSDRPLPSVVMSVLDDRFPELRVATTARAIADTSLAHHDLGVVRAMVTTAMQRELCTPDELAAELEAGPRNGSALLRRALLDVAGVRGLGGVAHSLPEAEAAELLERIGVTDFIANAAIFDANGRLLFRVDLLWPDLRAIVEVDSREFHFGEQDWKRTMNRHNALTALDYAVAHYPPSAITSGGLDWAYEVQAWLDSRAASLTARPRSA